MLVIKSQFMSSGSQSRERDTIGKWLQYIVITVIIGSSGGKTYTFTKEL